MTTQHKDPRSRSRHTDDLFIGKTMTWLLRHGAVKEGLPISPDGFVPLSVLLNHKSLKGKCTVEDAQRIVDNNNKQRYTLRTNQGITEIKANQGHSIQVAELELEPLLDPSTQAVHGTFFSRLDDIKRHGLSRMNRNHIHFASGLPGAKTVISGARQSAEVFIYVDLKKAMDEGIQFYRSPNGVILSSGKGGFLQPKYFARIEDRNGRPL